MTANNAAHRLSPNRVRVVLFLSLLPRKHCFIPLFKQTQVDSFSIVFDHSSPFGSGLVPMDTTTTFDRLTILTLLLLSCFAKIFSSVIGAATIYMIHRIEIQSHTGSDNMVHVNHSFWLPYRAGSIPNFSTSASIPRPLTQILEVFIVNDGDLSLG